MADSKSKATTKATPAFVNPLKQTYVSEVRQKLKDELKLENINQVPRLEKIVINVGYGAKKDDKAFIAQVETTLRKISAQAPVAAMAKKSIAAFKLREGQNQIGSYVTLRGDRMYDFLDKFINIVLPRLRDFHGTSTKAFDKQGNYSIGIIEQSVFPELNFEDTNILHGLQINIVTTAENSDQGRALLQHLGMPFEKAEKRN